MDGVAVFNGLPADRARQELLSCCASTAWAQEVAAGRPYRDRTALESAAGAAAESLSWADVLQGLAAHPRIGERAAGDSREARWSRQEQSAAETDRSALVAANKAYEARFGHVFLIFASGRTQPEILAAARERLTNDDTTERAIVTTELRKIALLRLGRLLDDLA